MVNIGIDFGTSNICISHNSTILLDSDGSYLIPSYIAFSDDILIGNAAKTINIDDKYKLHNLKRLVGKTFSDIDILHYPFTISSTNDDQIQIIIDNNTYKIEELLCFFFNKIKEIIKNNLSLTDVIVNAVITVPAYFNDLQRSIIKCSAEMASINVLKILNEPTAAAIAYFKNDLENKTIMVYDLGGGTLDITILRYEDGIYTVIETFGDPQLGGEDFDNVLAAYCLQTFCTQHKVNISSSKILHKIKLQCKVCREMLSTQIHYDIIIDSLYLGIDMNIRISRAMFEEICKEEFKRCENKIIIRDIDKVILVGGATRMPQIKNMISKKYPDVVSSIDPDTIVAIGAGIMAQELNGNNQIILLDVVQLPIGIEVNGGIMLNIIEKGSYIPCKQVKTFTTEYDNQPSLELNIWEGESRFAKQNNLLGKILISRLPLLKKGELKIYIKFKIDFNGILFVTVKYNDIKIKNTLTKNNQYIEPQNMLWINTSIELYKFKEHLVNQRSIPNLENKIETKISKLIDWINNINNKIVLDKININLNMINKMKENIDLEITNFLKLIST